MAIKAWRRPPDEAGARTKHVAKTARPFGEAVAAAGLAPGGAHDMGTYGRAGGRRRPVRTRQKGGEAGA
ncbi:hypothetical protein HMPREF0005_02930 [Achromobacter xylosoxidans C54]|nr:hypothetical protein HMPREF0005_02930 [Achromobacter xylosoxidans C54]